MLVYLDGKKSRLALDDIPPGWIAGIEVYKGPATAPMEFGGPCGSIIIWTGPESDAVAHN